MALVVNLSIPDELGERLDRNLHGLPRVRAIRAAIEQWCEIQEHPVASSQMGVLGSRAAGRPPHRDVPSSGRPAASTDGRQS